MGLRRAGGGTSGGSSGGGIREAGGRREGVSSCWRRAPSPRRGVPASSWRPPALGTRPLSPSRTSVDWALRAEPESPGLPPGAGSSPVRLRSERLPSRQGTGDPWGSSTPKASTTAGQERIREDGAQPLLQKLSKHSSRLHKLWHNNPPPMTAFWARFHQSAVPTTEGHPSVLALACPWLTGNWLGKLSRVWVGRGHSLWATAASTVGRAPRALPRLPLFTRRPMGEAGSRRLRPAQVVWR